MEVEEFVPQECLVLQQCNVCSRKFRADVLAKHAKICQKVSKRKTKIFDSGKQRATGTGIPISQTIRPGHLVPNEIKDEKIIRAENKKNSWRIKHEEFIRNIRAAKQYNVAKAKGRPLPPPPMPSQTINEDLVQCEYCQRRFNERAAERHIAFCREQQAKQRIVAGKPKKLPATVKPKAAEPRYAAPKPPTQVTPAVTGPRRPPNAIRGTSPQVRVSASPGTAATGVRSPPSRGSYLTSPQRGSTGSSGTRPQLSQRATPDSSQLATGPAMTVKRGVPLPRKTPEARYADESQNCTKLELPPITGTASCGFRDNSSTLAPCGDVTPSKPRLRPCLPGRQMRFKPDRPFRSVQRRLESQLPASDYHRLPPADLDRNRSNQSPDEQTNFAPGLPLRSGRTFQDYVDAHTFARDLASSRLQPSPNKLKQSSSVSRIDTSSRRGVSEQQFLEPIDYDHCSNSSSYQVRGESGHISHAGDRAVGRSPNDKLPFGNYKNATRVCSGIPVRATGRPNPASATLSNQTRPPPVAQVSGDAKGKFCPECGARLPNTATRFCPGCGVRRMAV